MRIQYVDLSHGLQYLLLDHSSKLDHSNNSNVKFYKFFMNYQ